MTAPISPVSVGPTQLVQTGDGALDREDFLELLVAQLRHQDPLNPMDGTQFASQLAEFSSLEQLISLNDGIDVQTTADARSQLALNTTLGSSLIGRSVMGYGDQIDVSGKGEHTVVVDVAGSGGSGVMEIYDDTGSIVYTKSVGGVAGGLQRAVSFDIDAALPPGAYHYKLTVTASDGSGVPVEHFTTGIVEGVFFGTDGVVLRVGSHLRITLDNLAEIEPSVLKKD